MPITPPVFNLTVDVWSPPNTPNAGAFDYQITAQMYLYSRVSNPRYSTDPTAWTPSMIFRTDNTIVSNQTFLVANCVLGVKDSLSNWLYYLVRWWDYTHLGFPNEYVALFCDQCDDLGVSPDARRG